MDKGGSQRYIGNCVQTFYGGHCSVIQLSICLRECETNLLISHVDSLSKLFLFQIYILPILVNNKSRRKFKHIGQNLYINLEHSHYDWFNLLNCRLTNLVNWGPVVHCLVVKYMLLKTIFTIMKVCFTKGVHWGARVWEESMDGEWIAGTILSRNSVDRRP